MFACFCAFVTTVSAVFCLACPRSIGMQSRHPKSRPLSLRKDLNEANVTLFILQNTHKTLHVSEYVAKAKKNQGWIWMRGCIFFLKKWSSARSFERVKNPWTALRVRVRTVGLILVPYIWKLGKGGWGFHLQLHLKRINVWSLCFIPFSFLIEIALWQPLAIAHLCLIWRVILRDIGQ